MSEIDELEGKIRKIKSEITEIKRNEEKYFGPFVESMNNIMEVNINEIVPKIVKSEAKVTNDLGKEKLIGIKEHVNKMILTNKSELTEKLKKYGFEEMLNWYKNRYNSIFGEQDSSYDIAKEMCEDVGLSIGKVKTYLLSIGYTGYSSIEGIKWTSTNIDSKHYPILEIKVYEFLKDKNIEEYVDEFWKLKNLEENLDSSENALSKLKAEDLWDSI